MEVTSGEGLGGDLWGEDDVEMTELRDATEVYRMHAIELTRFATALVGPSDAPDVVSDAVVSLLRSDRLAEANNQRALLCRVVLAKARTTQRSGFRRRARERRVAQRLVEFQPEIRPEVLDAVVRLSSQQRACVFLTYWEDLKRFLTAEQVTALAAAAENTQTGTGLIIETLAWVGMRWGELVALRRPRIHMLRRRIEIAESATELGSGLSWGTPKTHERRLVTMPAFLAERFAAHLGTITDDGLVFTAPRGGPLRSSPFRQSVWVPALEAAGLDRIESTTCAAPPPH